MNHASKTTFQWNYGQNIAEHVPEKDYMSENYKRMKAIAAEGQRKRHGPLKARFIPGVTKNDRYAHVQSKVGALLKNQSPQRSYSDELANRRIQHSQKFVMGGNGPQNRSTPLPPQINGSRNGIGVNQMSRLSRSSIDVRSQSSQSGYMKQQAQSLRRHGSISASVGGVNHQQQIMGARQSTSHPEIPNSRVQILQNNPPDESIYNWKFNDGPPVVMNDGDSSSTHNNCHRVEYLPCDGICAEETITEKTSGGPDSARSTSSRTSRACNTEETRIYPESHSYRILNLSPNHQDQIIHQELPAQPKGFYNGYNNGHPETFSQQRQPQRIVNGRNGLIIDGGGGDNLENSMKNMRIQESQQYNNMKQHQSSNGVKSTKETNINNIGLPHSLGSVPKYLKQRKEEWHNEEMARQEAERNSNIPLGYVLMSEDERIDNLRQFRKSYEMLIAELNRIPIRIDTIRVRNHKVELEKQLTRLEEAMKTFSRPKVWVKVDD